MKPRKALLRNKFENVSEGGLEPPRRWYIPESGIYHQSKLTQQGRPPGHFVGQERRRCRAVQRPGPRELRKRRAVSRNSAAGPGEPDGPRHDDDCLPGKHGNRLPLAARQFPHRSHDPETGPVFVASDLNPHEATPGSRPQGCVDGTFIWTASHDQRQCSLSTVSFAAAIVVGPEPRSSWSAHSEDERPGRRRECRRSAGSARWRLRRRCGGHHRR